MSMPSSTDPKTMSLALKRLVPRLLVTSYEQHMTRSSGPHFNISGSVVLARPGFARLQAVGQFSIQVDGSSFDDLNHEAQNIIRQLRSGIPFEQIT